MVLIKPCPYCGNVDPQIMHPAFNGDYMIYCGVYKCNIPYAVIGNTLEEAIETWNEYDTEVGNSKWLSKHQK